MSSSYVTNLVHICWKRPNLWLLVSIPVPMTRPPTVRSSSSGKIGMVQPSLNIRLFIIVTNQKLQTWGLCFKCKSFLSHCQLHSIRLKAGGLIISYLSRVWVSWPMVTRGSHLTVFFSVSISRMSTRLT